jgi:hypothetical protein
VGYICAEPRKRSDPKYRAYFILIDSRGWDRKHGFVCNLTEKFIKQEISEGCTYCLAKNKKMTLDRIDNKKGHVEDNVIGCCIDCNYIRKDMPFAAWTIVYKFVREARQKDLFGKWTGEKRRNK